MIDRKHRLPVVQQCRILELSRSSVYYVPQPVSAADLALMRQIDELHLQYPFAGSRMLRDILQLNGVAIGRKHVATLMRRMGIEALYQRPRTSTPHPGHKVFPYLLRNRQITAPNQAWAMDITYIPNAPGLCLFGRRPGLGYPARLVLAAIQQHDGGLLSGGRRGRDSGLRYPGDLEYGPRQPVHRNRLCRPGAAARYPDQHGRQRLLARQRLCRAPLEERRQEWTRDRHSDPFGSDLRLW